MKPVKDEIYAMFIVEKYETFVRYIYPMLVNMSGHIKWANSFNLKTKLLRSVA